MRRNDLNPEELRFERLLQSLDRAPAAPDPEFLRQLKEASTAAFVAARPARPRAERATNVPPPNPAVGRRRLQRLRVGMFSAVAALLFIGMLSPVLFPARGVELRVALDNLKRSSSYEIEIQNGAGSNTLLFARGDDSAAHWRVDYPSGNAEVSDGTATYFLNRGRNSLHPSPSDEPNLTPTFVEDKLLAGLNVNDPAEQSSLLKQRPETVVNQNGQQILVYNYRVPDANHAGETLTVNATVNAENNTLLAMNSEVKDAAGNSKLRANVDVKSVNSAIPIDRFQVDPQAELNEQIAMVEDVQGLAVVDEPTPLVVTTEARAGLAGQTEITQTEINSRADNSKDYVGSRARRQMTTGDQGLAEGAASAELPSSDELPSEKKREQSKLAMRAAAKPEPQMLKSMAAAGVASEPRGEVAPGAAGNAIAADKTTDRDANSGRLGVMKGQRLMKGAAVPGGMGGGGGGAGQPVAEPQNKLAQNRSEPAPAGKDGMRTRGGQPMASPPAAARQVGTINSPAPTLAEEALPSGGAKAGKFAGQKAAPQSGQRAAESAAVNAAPKGVVADAKSGMQRAVTGAESKRKADISEADVGGEKEALADSEIQAKVSPKPGESRAKQLFNMQLEQSVEAGNDALMEGAAQNSAPQSLKLNSAYSLSQNVLNGRGGEYGYGLVRRQVTPQTELLPGGVLKTEADPSNVVWARLANNSDLVVGPGSEVLLLKPTEVRLQAGELMLNVPPGDQVDLLGPEPRARADAEYGYRNLRRNQQQSKFPVSRQQVTGRGVFRIENGQLQRVDQEPGWLANYFVRQNATGQQSQKMRRQAIQSFGEPLDRSSKGAPEAKPAGPGPK